MKHHLVCVWYLVMPFAQTIQFLGISSVKQSFASTIEQKHIVCNFDLRQNLRKFLCFIHLLKYRQIIYISLSAFQWYKYNYKSSIFHSVIRSIVRRLCLYFENHFYVVFHCEAIVVGQKYEIFYLIITSFWSV